MEVRDGRGYCKEVGRLEKKVDGSVELFDKKGFTIGSVSKEKYNEMLCREANNNYARKTTPPWID